MHRQTFITPTTGDPNLQAEREREREREEKKKAEAGSRFNLPLKIPACITCMSIHLKGVSVVLQFVQKPPPRAPAVLDGIRTDVNFDVHTPLQGK